MVKIIIKRIQVYRVDKVLINYTQKIIKSLEQYKKAFFCEKFDLGVFHKPPGYGGFLVGILISYNQREVCIVPLRKY